MKRLLALLLLTTTIIFCNCTALDADVVAEPKSTMVPYNIFTVPEGVIL